MLFAAIGAALLTGALGYLLYRDPNLAILLAFSMQVVLSFVIWSYRSLSENLRSIHKRQRVDAEKATRLLTYLSSDQSRVIEHASKAEEAVEALFGEVKQLREPNLTGPSAGNQARQEASNADLIRTLEAVRHQIDSRLEAIRAEQERTQ